MTTDWQEITSCGLYPAPRLCGPDDRKKPDEFEVEMCRKWLRLNASQTKTIRCKYSSYWFKHVVEDWTRSLGPFEQVDPRGRSWVGGYLYVANGSFIEAALQEGFRVKRTDPGSPNAFLNIAMRKKTP